MFSKVFWVDAIERALSTMAQFALVLGGADGAGFLNMDFGHLMTLVAFGGVATILKAMAAYKLTPGNSASLTVENVEEK